MTVDTSDEAVRREIDLLCARLAGHGGGDTAWSAWAERTIALIKALVADLVAERDALRAAWLRVIQLENSCAATGHSCAVSKRCGCVEEQRMLIKEHTL